jgi:hypothetical protein
VKNNLAPDSDVSEHVGGGMAWAALVKWTDQNPVRRHTGAVIHGGKRLFDWRIARAQMRADIARWRRERPAPREVGHQPVGRFFPRPRRRAKRPASKATADSDDGEPDGAIGGAS